MSAAGRTAGAATENIMDRVKRANREILIDIVSADPNCNLPNPVIMSGEPPSGSRFCRDGGLDLRAHPNDWVMQRLAARDFAATLGIVASLSGYLDQIDGVVSRDPLDLAGEFAKAQADLLTIKNTANAIAGSDLGIPVLTAEQSEAISGALALLSVLIDEQNRVDDLQAIETVESRSLFAETVEDLRRANTAWVRRLQGQALQRRTLIEERLEGMTRAKEAERRPVVQSLLDTIEEQEKLEQLSGALAQVCDKLVQSHTAYLVLLDDRNAELTGAERRKAAKLNHDRVFGALKSLTALIGAF